MVPGTQLVKDVFGALDKKVLADTEALYAARLTNGVQVI